MVTRSAMGRLPSGWCLERRRDTVAARSSELGSDTTMRCNPVPAWRLGLALAAVLVAAGGPPLRQALAQSLPSAPEAGSGWRAGPPQMARKFMVATANPLATRAGADALRDGGTAVDAAIAVQLVLGLVEPQSSGLGGGAFLLHSDAGTGKLVAYDGREAAPAAAKLDRFVAKGRPLPFLAAVKSGLSIGVPGTVRLLEQAHRRHGRLPWPRLFADAIALAENGFAVSQRLRTLLIEAGPGPFNAEARRLYFDAAGNAWPTGHRLRHPVYAATLRRIADGGAAAFYEGAIASEIVRAAAVAPASMGSVTAADLAAYRVVEREPVCVGYRGHRVCGMGPPSSGAHAIGQALMLLEPWSLGSGPGAAMAPGPLHLLGEALKLAFADRNWYLADPAFVAVPAGLLDPAYIAERRLLIRPFAPMRSVFPGLPPGSTRQARAPDEASEASGTSHISIVDSTGNAVAMTTTVEAAFGSGRMAAGFLLNNELTDFSFRPTRDGRPIANRVEGGKRPRSSMSPTIVLGPDGRPAIVTGSAGGSRIIPYVLKTLVALIDWRMDAAAALALPNFAIRGGGLELEVPMVGGIAGVGHPAGAVGVVGTALRLKPLGHQLHFETMTSGTQVIVRRSTGILEGAADPRREGTVAGE
ncbi:MAG: gamma-glutamyltransferase family protein [Hyphomicrobiaceae bacterium]|nr:gamma-glutamyltransferase family protein [Hyphomicrobiaceae bacterium]